MIIAGAGGHAREIAGILAERNETGDLFFFDDFATSLVPPIWGKFPVVQRAEEAKKIIAGDPRFIIGVGKPALRKKMYDKFIAWGGKPYSIISPHAQLGTFNVAIGEGQNIMTGAVLTQDIEIGTGCLIHIHVSIHHDCRVGDFCELSPGCRLLGKAKLGNLVSIGSGAVILPGISIGDEAVIGAGAVVTKDIAPGITVKGVPAR
jgi:sugar O-acyltransferase (sialic acid O-acetyltransferase NeuD family)